MKDHRVEMTNWQYSNLHAIIGSADGYNTESPECLHINFAKEAYQTSNERDYIEQMAVWLRRREAMCKGGLRRFMDYQILHSACRL